jgi:ferredoxin
VITMKLVLDQTACQGYGLCQQAAPDLVDLDDWGYAGLNGDGAVPAHQHSHAHEAVSVCPAQALKVQK